MRNLFQYVGLRHLRHKPVRTFLTTLGVAFGVALYVAIAIINRSTLASFRESVDAVAGKAALTVSAGEAGFPEAKIEIMQKVAGVKQAIPMVETRAYLTNDRQARETVVVMGVDLLKEGAVRSYKTTDAEVIEDPLVFLNQPDSIIVTTTFAEAHRLKIDDRFELATAHGARKFTVRGMLSPEGPAKAYGGSVAIMDIDGARMTFGKEGKLDRVDIVLRTDAKVDDVAARLSTALGSGYEVERPETQSEAMERMVSSFQTIMQLFSMLALLVGVFLVTNSISIAVAERRREIGTLRSLGVTRRGILAVFLSEAVVMGAVGAFAGAWLGRGLASLLVGMVSRSMSGQYLTSIQVNRLDFGPWDVLGAVFLGAVAGLLAALWPALKAASIPPLEAMRRPEVGEVAGKRAYRRTPMIGAGLLAYTALVSYLHLSRISPRFNSFQLFCSMLGAALIAPWLVGLLIRTLRPVTARSNDIILRLAQDNLLRNPRRTGSNVMSLIVGLMLVIMIGCVNRSFRNSIVNWFDTVQRADLFVASSGRLASFQNQPMHEDVGQEISRVPGVLKGTDGKSGYALRFLHFRYEGQKLGLKAYDEPAADLKYSNLAVQDRPPAEAGWDLFHSEQPAAMVSENFVMHFKKRTGDTIDLDTPSGRTAFRIVGVVVDFASSAGMVYLDRRIYRKLWQDPLVNYFSIRVEPGQAPAEVRKAIDGLVAAPRNLITVSNSELRQDMIQIVDQAFSLSRAIETAALLVGLLGLLNTFLISVMERTRELGMLRAIGVSRRQVIRMILLESVFQGIFGAAVAVILGAAIAFSWITNSLSFILGWVIQFHFPWISVAGTLAIGILVALIAGFLPARRASKIEIVEALQYE